MFVPNNSYSKFPMAISKDLLEQINPIIDKISGEVLMIQPDNDNGMIPTYSLLNDIEELSACEPLLFEATKFVKNLLDTNLDEGKVWDTKLVGIVKDFDSWAVKTIYSITDEQPIEAFQHIAQNSVETDSPKAEQNQQFDAALTKISNEIALAVIGKDEGMIPIYSILTDLEAISVEEITFMEAILIIKSRLDDYFDEAKTWDAPLIGLIKQFIPWFRKGMKELLNDEYPDTFNPHDCSAENTDIAAEKEETTPVKAVVAAEAPLPEEELLVVNLEEDMELLTEFYNEATEHLEAIEGHVLTLEGEPENVESINAVFRAFHTIKGVAGFLALMPIQNLAHEVESLLDLIRNGEMQLNSKNITLILSSRDALVKLVEQMMECINNGIEPVEIIPIQAIIRRVVIMMDPSATPAPADEPKETNTQPIPEDEEQKEELREALPLEDIPVVTVPSPTPTAAPTAKAKKVKTVAATIRVDSDKVTNLMDMVGELVIVESQLSEAANIENHSADSHLIRSIGQLNRITKDLQHTSMALRLVPIKPTFQKVSRMVRDIGRNSGKEVAFEMSGEDTELDRNVVESIADPLTHMVRNAIDHGLEATPDDREAVGKPRHGTISIKAYHQGSNIVIELSDNGRGINREKVLAKAREKGIVPDDRDPSPEEIDQLIFAAGFSTADKVTDISGRGVGMDVVRKNIDALRGNVIVRSVDGQGTNFKIQLPLTTAIIEGLVIKVGEDKFILPTNSVRVSMRPQPEQLRSIAGNREVVVMNDETIPILRLHRQFGIYGAEEDPSKACLVLIESKAKIYALLVDELVHKQEVVIKSLGQTMRNIEGVSGGAILGDGCIALILDTTSLVEGNTIGGGEPALAAAGAGGGSEFDLEPVEGEFF